MRPYIRHLFEIGAIVAGCQMLSPAETTAAPPGLGCTPAEFRLALDIGHYRAAPGAISATGNSEFDYNRALAEKMRTGLSAAGFIAVTLIGESGTPIRLEERTRLAKAAGAALFVSLHHDSVQPRYLTDWTVSGRPQRYSDRFHGFSIFVSAINRYSAESETFATRLAEALVDEGLTPSLHHAEPIPGEGHELLNAALGLYRFDDLVVLRTAEMPAVLLESAIIINRSEEQQVREGSYHAKVVAAMVSAIKAYCADRATAR
jgi:N-acetylmuramoyl-L-alanine amidase